MIFSGAASLNAKMNGMIALRTIVYFLVTSLISALLGLAMVLIIHPGNPETKNLLGDGNTAERKVDIVDNFLDLGRNLFPDNLFQASFQTVSTKILTSKLMRISEIFYSTTFNSYLLIGPHQIY